MSSSEENESGTKEATINGDELNGDQLTPTRENTENGASAAGERIVELLQEEREGASTPQQMGNGINAYKAIPLLESLSEDRSTDALRREARSPVDSMLSVPDDSPSVQVG